MNQLVLFDPDKNMLSIGNITPPSEVSDTSETKEDSEILSLSSFATKCHIDDTLGDLTIASTFDLDEMLRPVHDIIEIPEIIKPVVPLIIPPIIPTKKVTIPTKKPKVVVPTVAPTIVPTVVPTIVSTIPTKIVTKVVTKITWRQRIVSFFKKLWRGDK